MIWFLVGLGVLAFLVAAAGGMRWRLSPRLWRILATLAVVAGMIFLYARGLLGFAMLLGAFLLPLFQGGGQSPPAGAAPMSRDEALAVLGLAGNPTEGDIRAAHRRLMQQAHPDVGGSDWLASRINQARDILLG